MIKNKDLISLVEDYYEGNPAKIERLEICSDSYPLSEDPKINLLTEGHTFWQVEDLSRDNMPNLRELCIVDEPVFGAVEVANLDFCMVAECPHVHITIRGVSYDIRGTREKAWIYVYKDGEAKISRE